MSVIMALTGVLRGTGQSSFELPGLFFHDITPDQ